MIILNVTYKCKPGMANAFLKALMAEGIDEKCRREDGNIQYDYFVPSMSCEAGEDVVLLIEKWRDAEALAVHSQQPHFQKIGEIKPEFVEDTEVNKFVVE